MIFPIRDGCRKPGVVPVVLYEKLPSAAAILIASVNRYVSTTGKNRNDILADAHTSQHVINIVIQYAVPITALLRSGSLKLYRGLRPSATFDI